MSPKVERNQAIARSYEAGATVASVAAAFGLTKSNAYRIICEAGAQVDDADRLARVTAANRRKNATAEHRAKVSAGVTAWWAKKRMGGNGPLSCTQTDSARVYGCPL